MAAWWGTRQPMRSPHAKGSAGVSPAGPLTHERQVIWTRRRRSIVLDLASAKYCRPLRSRTSSILPAMANATQILPRFLLPRLSWTAPVGQPLAKASVAFAPRHSQRSWHAPPPSRSMHTERPSQRLLANNSVTSTRSQPRQPALRRAFHASALRQRDHHFDTLKFVQRLQSEGFTEEQSVAMMKVLNDVIQER